MTVGDYLDAAAAGLARAVASMRDHPAASADEQATVAVARSRIYRQLYRQLTLITGVEQHHWIRQIPTGDPDAGRLAKFSELLRDLTLNTNMANLDLLPDVPVRGPVGTALHRAAHALTAANRIIAAHVGDPGSPHTFTPEGAALAAGYHEVDNVANIGQLAVATIDLDSRISERRWLTPGSDAGPWRTLLLRADQDVRDVGHVLQVDVARQLAQAGNGVRGFSRSLAPLPRFDRPSAWTAVTTARQAIAAMDAARLSLHRNGNLMTAAQLAAVVRAGLVVTVNASQVLLDTGTTHKPAATAIRPTLQRWSQAARAAGELRSPGRTQVPPVTVTSTALGAVSTWLAGKLRTDIRVLNTIAAESESEPEPGSRQSERLVTAWRQTAGQILTRLHDVTDSLRTAAETIRMDGGLHRPAERDSHPGRLIETAQWRAVQREDPVFQRLTNSLAGVSNDLRSLASMTGQPSHHNTALAPARRHRQTASSRHPPAAGLTAGPASTSPHLPVARPSRPHHGR